MLIINESGLYSLIFVQQDAQGGLPAGAGLTSEVLPAIPQERRLSRLSGTAAIEPEQKATSTG